LFQAQADHASELLVAISAGGGIKYKVESNWYDLSPPPSHILPGVVAELGNLAGFGEEAFPKEGRIDVAYSGVRLQWNIRMASADAPCVLTPIRK
jgi:hypothetical protein